MSYRKIVTYCYKSVKIEFEIYNSRIKYSKKNATTTVENKRRKKGILS